jgi:hypothetical protein
MLVQIMVIQRFFQQVSLPAIMIHLILPSDSTTNKNNNKKYNYTAWDCGRMSVH